MGHVRVGDVLPRNIAKAGEDERAHPRASGCAMWCLDLFGLEPGGLLSQRYVCVSHVKIRGKRNCLLKRLLVHAAGSVYSSFMIRCLSWFLSSTLLILVNVSPCILGAASEPLELSHWNLVRSVEMIPIDLIVSCKARMAADLAGCRRWTPPIFTHQFCLASASSVT